MLPVLAAIQERATLDALTICRSASMTGPDWNIETSSLNDLKRLRRCRIVVPISIRTRNSSSISGRPSSRRNVLIVRKEDRAPAIRLPMMYRVADGARGESAIEDEDELSTVVIALNK